MLIVTGSGDCTAKAWSLETAKCVRTFRGHLGAINTMATDDSGRTLFTGSMDQTIRSFEVETGRPLFVFAGHDGPVLYLSVSCCFACRWLPNLLVNNQSINRSKIYNAVSSLKTNTILNNIASNFVKYCITQTKTRLISVCIIVQIIIISANNAFVKVSS